MTTTHPLLTPQEVADIFRVDVRTVTGWARDGRIRATQTAGKQWRFRLEDVQELIEREGQAS